MLWNYTMFYLGGVKSEKGVVMNWEMILRFTKMECYSDRLMFVKIRYCVSASVHGNNGSWDTVVNKIKIKIDMTVSLYQ